MPCKKWAHVLVCFVRVFFKYRTIIFGIIPFGGDPTHILHESPQTEVYAKNSFPKSDQLGKGVGEEDILCDFGDL